MFARDFHNDDCGSANNVSRQGLSKGLENFFPYSGMLELILLRYAFGRINNVVNQVIRGGSLEFV